MKQETSIFFDARFLLFSELVLFLEEKPFPMRTKQDCFVSQARTPIMRRHFPYHFSLTIGGGANNYTRIFRTTL